MSCGHSISSEGMILLLEYSVSLKEAEIKCPVISKNPINSATHKKCNQCFDYNDC
jgi:hypothetical protein